MGGHVEATSGVKGIGDLFGKATAGRGQRNSRSLNMWRRLSGTGTDVYILFWHMVNGVHRHDHRGRYVSCL